MNYPLFNWKRGMSTFISLKAIVIIFIIFIIMEILNYLTNDIIITRKGKLLATELKRLYNADLNKVRTFRQLLKWNVPSAFETRIS